MLGPVPQPYQVGRITLNGLSLMFVPGQYRVLAAERFGDKISTGAIQYKDFNVYESAWEATSWAAGYGLNRYSDLGDGTPRRMMYTSADGVDAREDGIALLGPALQLSGTILPSTPIWIGEYTPNGSIAGTYVVVVTEDGHVYTVDSGFALTLRITLPASPQRGAIGVFNARLVFGYGASRTAQYTTDLVALTDVRDATPSNLYVWAFTADRAAAYVAGGPASTDWNKVVSSADGGDSYSAPANAVICGSSQSKITELAPGGGLVTVYVGKETELGAIDSTPNYRVLVPYDSRLSTNSRLLKWWLGSDGEENRGPLVLFFSRERALWSYQPSSETAGTARNMSPWSKPGIRPLEIRGLPTALQGTARWLYYTVSNGAGSYWMLCQDSRTAAVHSIVTLDENSCQAMSTSSLIGSGPRLYFGYGNRLATLILPLDGDSPLGNSEYPYVTEGTLDLPAIDFDFPDEQKILFSVRIIADNLLAAARSITVWASYDDADYVELGTVASSPGILEFPTSTSVRRVSLRLVLSTTDETQTPQLRAVVLRASINPKLYRIWEMQAYLNAGSLAGQGDDLQNPKTSIDSLWSAFDDGFPVSYQDRWNDFWTVRIIDMTEQESRREADRPPESIVTLRLLQVARVSSGETRYDAADAVYEDPAALYG